MKLLYGEKEILWIFERMAIEILEKNKSIDNLGFVGIRTRGVYIAKRLHNIIERITGNNLNFGILDITLYRDDLSIGTHHPVVKSSEIDFNIDDMVIILVDDVIYTGRTTRAAIDAIFDIGRPKAVQLAVLIDRGHRELPIQPDFVGKVIPTSKKERIYVKLKEIDEKDEILIGDI
jgi:pyrimidine operon attenuation protein/uracil phosphoribosyltransferase